MKRRNLVILLLMPFIISLLGLTAINLTFNIFENDIIDIEWKYKDVEGFKISEEKYLLEAEPISDTNYPSLGNELVWTLKNKDLSDEEQHAEIIIEKDNYYLSAISEGEVIVTVSNQKGNISKSMTAVIYQTGMVVINPIIGGSQNNVDETLYYGEYDLKDNQKVNASIEYHLQVVPSSLASTIEITSYSDEIITPKLDTVNLGLTLDILKEGDAYLTLSSSSSDIKSYTTSFKVVDNGVNVYTYNDLLNCTNKSENGEIIVLRKSFDSLANTYKFNSNNDLILNNDRPVKKYNNVELFGNYDVRNDSYSFDKEVYSFDTTYNDEYIDQWNEFAASSNGNYQSISKKIVAGLRVQKDVYGNGYTLNLHNLAYPYSYSNVTVDGTTYIVPKLRNDNLFRGPLPFYTLGDPNGLPLVGAYGQDNIGMYVDGSNIKINDLVLKNCDFGNNLANLDYTGNVIEVHGNNITLQNSRFSNGKNVLRSFSSNNVLINNCMLSYSRNFLITTGSNEYISVDEINTQTFMDLDGKVKNESNNNYLSKGGLGDTILNSFINGSFDKEKMNSSLKTIQRGLDEEGVNQIYKGEMTIKDTYFYKSGVASIALESQFNGPYLYSNSPSIIGMLFSEFSEGANIVPYEANHVSGTSYPVKVNLEGKTTFFDYKNSSTIDLGGLILENISAIANSLGQNVRPITIDDIFPIRQILDNKSSDYHVGECLNIPVAYYGGGMNYSIINDELLENKFTTTLEVDLLDSYLNLPNGGNAMTQIKYMMQKCVTVVTGFHPFKFSLIKGDSKDVNKAPTVELLKENAKGGNSNV